MDLAIAKAKQSGCAWVTARGIFHTHYINVEIVYHFAMNYIQVPIIMEL